MEKDMYAQVSEPKYDCLLFGEFCFPRNKNISMLFEQILKRLSFAISDVDDTLYPLSSGLSKEVTKNIIGNDSKLIVFILCLFQIYIYW